jgi:hypothetical protein
LRTSYSRRRGAYTYDIEVHEVVPPTTRSRFFARVVNMVRHESGQTVSVDAQLPDERAATRHEAVSKIEGVVEAWVQDQPQQS